MRDLEQYVKFVGEALSEHLADDIKVLNIGKISVITEYFVIAGAKNENHMRALQEAVEERLGKEGVHPLRVEGARSDEWLLLDYGDFVIHIFGKEEREFYNIERIWADAPEIEYKELG